MALPVLTINQPCQRLKSSKIRDIVVVIDQVPIQVALRYYLQHLKKAKQLQQQHLKWIEPKIVSIQCASFQMKGTENQFCQTFI